MPQNYNKLRNTVGAAWYNTSTADTSYFSIPKGTTAQRPASPAVGDIRYNTTIGGFEFYATDWVQVTGLGITSVSPTSYNGANSSTFTISGTGFVAGTSVKFITNNGTAYTAGTVTINGLTSITASTPRAFTVSEEPLDVQVISPSGVTATLQDVIDCGGSPTWATAAGTLATINDRYGSYGTIATLSATDPDGSVITYTVTSGSLPGNVSLNASSGVISGDPTDVVSDTTYNFTVSASDIAANATARSFAIIVNKTIDGSSAARSATSASALLASGVTTSGNYYITDPSGTPVETLCLLSGTGVLDSGGWTLAYNININDGFSTGLSANIPGTGDCYGHPIWSNSGLYAYSGSIYSLVTTNRAVGAHLSGISKILIMYHTGNFASPVATAYYTRGSGVNSQSLQSWFNGATRDQVWSTGGRQGIYTYGFTQATYNSDRAAQTFTGDPFAESGNSRGNYTSHALGSFDLVLNSSVNVYGSGADLYNDCRFTTTMCNDNTTGNGYGHVVQHGIGVRHSHGNYGGSVWLSLGQNSYCDMRKNHVAGNGTAIYTWGNAAFGGSCINGSYTTSNSSVSGVAIFVK